MAKLHSIIEGETDKCKTVAAIGRKVKRLEKPDQKRVEVVQVGMKSEERIAMSDVVKKE